MRPAREPRPAARCAHRARAPKRRLRRATISTVLNLFAEPVAAAIAKAGLYEAERANVAKLLESDRMKSQFVASVSHELRTPITSIRGAVAASRRTDHPAQREELLDVVDRQSGRLQSMVEEMLVAAQDAGERATARRSSRSTLRADPPDRARLARRGPLRSSSSCPQYVHGARRARGAPPVC